MGFVNFLNFRKSNAFV